MIFLKILIVLIILDAAIIWEFVQSGKRRERREIRQMLNDIFNQNK